MKVFEDRNGQFTCSNSSQTEGEIRSVLNLYRASLVAFPGEKVMEEAQIFSSAYLKEALQKILVSSLSREVSSTHIFLTFVCFTMWYCYIMCSTVSIIWLADRGRSRIWLAHKFAKIGSKELHGRIWTGFSSIVQ